MSRQNPRQRLRQREGFLAENLLQRYFEDRGILAVSFVRRHLDEVGGRTDPFWRNRAKALAKRLIGMKGIVGSAIERQIEWESLEPPTTKEEKVVRALLGFCDLIRWEADTPVISEVKSQYGPALDYRIEFQATQMIALREIAQRGVEVSIIYYVALPRPRFVEFPWSAIRRPERKVTQEMIGAGHRYRTRVPRNYRDEGLFVEVPQHSVPYTDEASLLTFLQTAFGPGTRPGIADVNE